MRRQHYFTGLIRSHTYSAFGPQQTQRIYDPHAFWSDSVYNLKGQCVPRPSALTLVVRRGILLCMRESRTGIEVIDRVPPNNRMQRSAR
jgi:hypothetical protein